LEKAAERRDKAAKAARRARDVVRGAKKRAADAAAASAAQQEANTWKATEATLDSLLDIGVQINAALERVAALLEPLDEHGRWVLEESRLPPGIKQQFDPHRLEKLIADHARVHYGIRWAGEETATDSPRNTPKLIETLAALREAALARRPGAEPEA